MDEALAIADGHETSVKKPGAAKSVSSIDSMKKAAKFRAIGTKRGNNALTPLMEEGRQVLRLDSDLLLPTLSWRRKARLSVEVVCRETVSTVRSSFNTGSLSGSKKCGLLQMVPSLNTGRTIRVGKGAHALSMRRFHSILASSSRREGSWRNGKGVPVSKMAQREGVAVSSKWCTVAPFLAITGAHAFARFRRSSRKATRLRASATSSGSGLITIAYVVGCPRPGSPLSAILIFSSAKSSSTMSLIVRLANPQSVAIVSSDG